MLSFSLSNSRFIVNFYLKIIFSTMPHCSRYLLLVSSTFLNFSGVNSSKSAFYWDYSPPFWYLRKRCNVAFLFLNTVHNDFPFTSELVHVVDKCILIGCLFRLNSLGFPFHTPGKPFSDKYQERLSSSLGFPHTKIMTPTGGIRQRMQLCYYNYRRLMREWVQENVPFLCHWH